MNHNLESEGAKKNHQFKIVQIKSLATHMTKLILQNIFMEHDLYLIS